jgi:Domain of unknown function (DU1801)
MITSASEYIATLAPDRQAAVQRLHDTIMEALPDGFTDIFQYGGIGYVVPKTIYPAGYHCDTKQPLPFAGLISQKNSVNFYHMAIYADPELEAWWRAEYPKHCTAKLDMGKSCIRFAKLDQIPYQLIAELMTKVSVDAWVERYEAVLKK